jgi:hypothetical protein
MEETMESLEKKRENLYRDLREVGDFRRGIISVIYRKCGKKYCACAKEGHPGHGPLHLWNTTIKGKIRGQVLQSNNSSTMARPLRIGLAGGLYHVTSRGDRREDIFLCEGRPVHMAGNLR